MTAHSRQVPLGLMSQASGEMGYRAAVLHVARDDAGPGATDGNSRQELLDLAVPFAGGNTGRTSWQFPLSVPGLDRDSNKLLADWNRRTEGHLTDILIGHLVVQLRMWRPSVLLLEEPTAGDALTRTIQQAALHAVEQAADPACFPQHQEAGGLAAWQVAKVFTRLPAGSKGPLSLDPHQYLPRMGGTAQVISAAARGLLLDSSLAPTVETFRLKKSNIPNLREDLAGVDFFSGLGISPGTAARREMPAVSDSEMEKQLEIAKRQRNVNAVMARSMQDERLSSQMIAQLGTVIRDMSPAQAALQLQQTAAAYLANGRCNLAEQTMIELAERYPDEPAAAQAMVWLVQYWGSQETTWQRVRREKIGKIESTPNLEAAERRMTRAAARIRRQVDEESRRNDLLPRAPSESEEPADNKPEIIPTEFSVQRDHGHLDPEEQFKSWQRRSREMSLRLESRIPGIYREPQVQYPLASLARKLGNPLRSDEIFRRFMPREGVESPGLVAREIWLTNPVTPPALPPALCGMAAETPKLDGVLSDPCWQHATELPLSAAPNGAAGERHAFVMMCRDEKYLYLAGSFPRAAGTRTDGTVRRARQYDEDLQDFDRLQILLDVDRDYFTYYDFQVDQRGCTSEACWQDRSWNPKWYVATQSDEQHWRVEIAIPFTELVWRAPGSEKPGPGVPAKTWGLSLVRTIPAVAVETWVHPAPATPQPESFGLLRFE